MAVAVALAVAGLLCCWAGLGLGNETSAEEYF